MEKEKVFIFKKVLKWAKNTWNFPKEIRNCYNCIHENVCSKKRNWGQRQC